MAITASCGNCGKTYQAPDRMAGKSVRCKQCGEVFRIDAGDVGGLDLDGLEQSFGDELATGGATALHGTAQGTRHGTRQGPSLDEHGRPRIERRDDVEGFSIAASHAPGFRSNYRFRYPGAKLVDQFAPIVLVVGTIALLTQASMNSGATIDEQPTPPIAISRLMILLAAYLFLIWPASHIALRMASVKTRFSMPSAAIWRSFAAFTPVLLMGGWLFIKSGGGGVPLAMGLFVGVALAVGAVALLFRVFANEVPTVAAYVAVGSLGSSIFAALAIVAINMLGVALARLDKSPTLFMSPIAIGLPWIDKPAETLTATKATKKPITTATPATANTAPPPPVVDAGPSQTLPLPEAVDGVQLLKSLELTPVRVGFDELIFPAVASHVMGVVRTGNGGSVEVWDTSTWTQPTKEVARDFDRSQGPVFIDTTGKKVFRFVHNPRDRFENLPLGDADLLPPLNVNAEPLNRTVIGFADDIDILVKTSSDGRVGLERYGLPGLGANKFFSKGFDKDGKPQPLSFAPTNTLRVLPNGSGMLVAARDPSADNGAVLVLYLGLANPEKPETSRTVVLNGAMPFAPRGLAIRDSGRTAMLQEFGGELSLTVYDLRERVVDGKKIAAPDDALIDSRRIGTVSSLKPDNWNDDCDPLLWIDDNTLLLYGSVVLDVQRGGRKLGMLNVNNVTEQHLATSDGAVLLIQSTGSAKSLLQAKLDLAALERSRAR